MAAAPFTTRPVLRGSLGMVASTHWLASAAGMAMLERGGNAFDAAVAAGLVLQVVEPEMNGPGGEVPILARPAGGEVVVIAGQGPAPAAATAARLRALGLEIVPGTGLLPACVPGAFDAWMLLLAEHGTLRLGEVMAPAITYAGDGYPIGASAVETIAAVEPLLREEWTDSAALYVAGGLPRPGARFRNPALAETYARIVRESERASGSREGQIERARDAFYRGFVAEAIAAYVERAEVMDSSGRRHRGLMTADDLAGWRAPREEPVWLDYRGLRVYKTGPWGQGPVFLQQLALVAGFDLAAMGPESDELVHVVVECCKLAMADREAWYGDPRLVDVPMTELLDAGYAAERRRLVGDEASAELRPGNPGGRCPRLASLAAAGATGPAHGVGEPTLAGEGDTCHLDAVDRHGNLVSATPSGGWLQSSPVIPELGFCLGTRGQMFWLEEGLPGTLAPGKRPRTTLTPSIALGDGRELAFGTPGGDMQDQWSLLFFLRHVDFGLGLQAAIDAPAFHSNHAPSSFYPRDRAPLEVEIESRFAPATLDRLRARGHELALAGPWSLGRVSAAGRDRDGLVAAANARGMQGYAAGR